MPGETVTLYCTECSNKLQYHKVFAKRLGMCPECKALHTIPTHDVSMQSLDKKDGKKCPNCFEINVAKTDKCKYCGEFLGKYDLNEICPNCKEEQVPENKYCRNCGVNMKTGLIDGMTRRPCPRCGIISSGMETVCVVCQTPLDATPSQVKVEKAAQSFIKVFADNFSLIILLAFIVTGAYVVVNWNKVRTSFSSSYYGSEEAELRDAVRRLAAALKYHDWNSIQQMVKGTLQLDYSCFAMVTGISKVKDPEAVYTLVECKISGINISGNQAMVYMDLVYKKTSRRKLKTPDTKPKDTLEAWAEMSRKLKEAGGSSAEKLAVTWEWHNINGVWKLEITE